MRQLGHVLLFAALLGPAVACRDEMAPDVDLVGVRSCQVGEYPLSGAPFVVDGPRQFIVSPAEVCPDINLEIAALAITVYHPQPLPDLGLPTVIMTNDVGLDATQYEHVLVPLAAQGFIVASVQTGGEVVERAAELSCALRWLRIDWSAEDQTVRPDQSPARFNCDLVLMGHGHGAEAAWIVGDNLRTIPWADVDPLGFDMQLRALVGLAPGFHRLSGYSPERSVPYLAIMGSTDERLPGAAIAAYDAMSSEAVATQDDPGKLILWPYDVPHAAFGGMPAASAGPDDAKGHAIAAAFVPLFLEHFVLGDVSHHGLFTGDELPASLADERWWSDLEPAFTELGRAPVLLRAFTLDQRQTPAIRRTLEDFEAGGSFTSTLSGGQVKVDALGALVPGGPLGGSALQVHWGEALPGGGLTWQLGDTAGTSLADDSYFSVRVGQGFKPFGFDACALPADDPRRTAVTLSVRLTDSQGAEAEAELGPIVQQDARRVGPEGDCIWSPFLSTLRVPLAAFCTHDGFDVDSVASLTIELPELAHEVFVFLDTLEFTRHPLEADQRCR
jgi:hypothetical protein